MEMIYPVCAALGSVGVIREIRRVYGTRVEGQAVPYLHVLALHRRK